MVALIIASIMLTACTEDPLVIKKKCSANDTYCEDLARTDGDAVIYQNLSTAFDTRDPTNNNVYEDLTT